MAEQSESQGRVYLRVQGSSSATRTRNGRSNEEALAETKPDPAFRSEPDATRGASAT